MSVLDAQPDKRNRQKINFMTENYFYKYPGKNSELILQIRKVTVHHKASCNTELSWRRIFISMRIRVLSVVALIC